MIFTRGSFHKQILISSRYRGAEYCGNLSLTDIVLNPLPPLPFFATDFSAYQCLSIDEPTVSELDAFNMPYYVHRPNCLRSVHLLTSVKYLYIPILNVWTFVVCGTYACAHPKVTKTTPVVSLKRSKISTSCVATSLVSSQMKHSEPKLNQDTASLTIGHLINYALD